MNDRILTVAITFLFGFGVGVAVVFGVWDKPAPQVRYVDKPMQQDDLRFSLPDLLRYYEPPQSTTEDCIQIPQWLARNSPPSNQSDSNSVDTKPDPEPTSEPGLPDTPRRFVLLPRQGDQFAVTSLGRHRIRLQTILPSTGAGMDVEIDRSGDFFWGPVVGVGYTTNAELSARVGVYVERGNFRLSGGVRAGDNLTQDNPVKGFAQLVYTPAW